MTTTTFKECDRCKTIASEAVRVSGQTLCPDCHDANLVFCSICGDGCFGDPDIEFVCSDCLEDSDGNVGTYRVMWDLSLR